MLKNCMAFKTQVIMHEGFEGPAAIEVWGKTRNIAIEYTRLYQGHSLPHNANEFDFLIVMGGPQSPSTTVEQCAHFDAKKEIDLIQKTARAGKPVLGICLGAQLLGEAMGGKFESSPKKEIGVFDISLTEEGQKDPLLRGFPATFGVGHWHNDMPGLTPDSTVLAISEGCPRQIVKYGPHLYGFQCHFEFTTEAVEGLIQNGQDELHQGKHLPYVQTPEELRGQNYHEMNQLLFRFLDKFHHLRA